MLGFFTKGALWAKAQRIKALLASDPDLSSLKELLLPYRDDLFDTVNAEMAGFERCLSVG